MLKQLLFQTELINDSAENLSSSVGSILGSLGIGGSLMSLGGALLILIIGFFVAKSASNLLTKLIRKTKIDDKLDEGVKLSSIVGKIVYYLLMIVVLLAALNMVGVGAAVLSPLNEMLSEFIGYVPNIIAAGIIGYAGYFLANIVSEFVGLSGNTIKKLAPKFNLPENIDIVNVIKKIVFIVVFVPIMIVALDALQMKVITDPAKNMLNTFINAIPSVIYAVVILLFAFIGGKYISTLIKGLLDSLKLNNLAEKLMLDKVLGDTNISKAVGNIAFFFIVYFASIEALNQLGLSKISDIFVEVLHIGGNVLFGLLILSLGNIVSNFAVKLFSKGEDTNKFTLSIVKGAIMVIFLAMGLHAMGIANSIIELAFGLGLGALAVAFALAFGLGGREAAGEEAKEFFKKFKK